MGISFVALILSLINIIFIIYLFLGFKSFSNELNETTIPSHTHSPSTLTGNGDGPGGLNETEVKELISQYAAPGGGTTIVQEAGEDGFRNASSTELGYEVSVTGHNLVLNKNPLINAWTGMIVPFHVDFNHEKKINELKSYGWFLCDGGNEDPEIPDLRARFIWGGGSGEAYGHAEAQITNTNYNTFPTYGGTGVEFLSENQMPRHKHSSPIRDIGYCAENSSDWSAHFEKGCNYEYNGNYLMEGTGGYLDTTGYFDARHPETFDQSGNHTVGIGGGMGIKDGTTIFHGNEASHKGLITYKDGKYTGGTRKTDVEDRAGNYQTHNKNGEKINNLPPYYVMAYFIYLPHRVI